MKEVILRLFWIKNNSEASGLEIFLFFSFLETKPTATDSSEPTPVRNFFNFSNLLFCGEKKLFRNFDECASAGKNFKNDV